jgi:hypothetical protein
MKRPRPIIASIVASFAMIALSAIVSTRLSLSTSGSRIIPALGAGLFFVALYAVDVIFLIKGAYWAYWYNLAIYALLDVIYGLGIIGAWIHPKNILGSIVVTVLASIVIGLVTWMILSLLLRKDVHDYFAKKKNRRIEEN